MTSRITILDARIASLEERILNFEYAHERLTTLLANAEPTEKPQYEQAIAANRATVESLNRKLHDERPKLARYSVAAFR